MLKTLSADAELGCTKRTFFTTEEQLSRFASFLDHHCSFSSSVCKSAPSATAKYLGSSAVSPCMMASYEGNGTFLTSPRKLLWGEAAGLVLDNTIWHYGRHERSHKTLGLTFSEKTATPD